MKRFGIVLEKELKGGVVGWSWELTRGGERELIGFNPSALYDVLEDVKARAAKLTSDDVEQIEFDVRIKGA